MPTATHIGARKIAKQRLSAVVCNVRYVYVLVNMSINSQIYIVFTKVWAILPGFEREMKSEFITISRLTAPTASVSAVNSKLFQNSAAFI